MKPDFSKENILYFSDEQVDIKSDEFKKDGNIDYLKIRKKVEPWLTALFQSEHLSLLVGTGLSIAFSKIIDGEEKNNENTSTNPKSLETESKSNDISAKNNNLMSRITFSNEVYKNIIKNAADNEAKNLGRGAANVEDDLRVALKLLDAYQIMEKEKVKSLKNEINKQLEDFLIGILRNEKEFIDSLIKKEKDKNTSNPDSEGKAELTKLQILKNFLLSFGSRTATRERLNIFTTNYDRFIEYGLDEAGLLTIDRFIGKLQPIMRFQRIDLDYHYNPPGIRGEPRYVEGVVKLTKLHGSLDWKFEKIK